MSQNPLITFSFEIAKAIHKKCAISGLILPSRPPWLHPLLTARGKTLLNEIWQLQNITQIGQIVENGDILPFSELKLTFRA